jgi:hypothetical protein
MPLPGLLSPKKQTQYPMYRRLGGPKHWSGQMQKISPTPRFHPQTIQLIRSCYTDYAIQTHIVYIAVFFNCMFLCMPMLFISCTTLKFFKCCICVNITEGNAQKLKRNASI